MIAHMMTIDLSNKRNNLKTACAILQNQLCKELFSCFKLDK